MDSTCHSWLGHIPTLAARAPEKRHHPEASISGQSTANEAEADSKPAIYPTKPLFVASDTRSLSLETCLSEKTDPSLNGTDGRQWFHAMDPLCEGLVRIWLMAGHSGGIHSHRVCSEERLKSI